MNWKYDNGRIFSVDEKNELLAETTFNFKENGEVDIDHTYVSPALRGRGLAGTMMEVVVKYLRERGLKASASCPYAKAWLQKHKESYPDIVSIEIDGV